jgi:hypothetical protein
VLLLYQLPSVLPSTAFLARPSVEVIVCIFMFHFFVRLKRG